MKILIINSVYKEGSTGKIVFDLSESLRMMGNDVLCCYGIGLKKADDHSIRVCSRFEHFFNALLGRITGIPYGGLFISNIRLNRIIRRFQPDVVHLHCINGYMVNVYYLMKYLAKKKIKTVLSLHAEIFHTAGCSHAYECEKWRSQCQNCKDYKREVGSWLFDMSRLSWKKMFESVNSFDSSNIIVTAVSPWLTERVSQSGIMKNYNVVSVPNGLDTKIFYRREGANYINKQGYERMVLFVTPSFSYDEDDIKGGRYIIPIAKTLCNHKFVVIASKISDNIGRLPDNVQIWGRASNQDELAHLYSEADITMLLSRRETFSMVTAESLCCGTPVVGFRAGGPESIAIKEFSSFVEYGNVPELIEAIKSFSKLSFDHNEIERIAASMFNSQAMALEYFKQYECLLR